MDFIYLISNDVSQSIVANFPSDPVTKFTTLDQDGNHAVFRNTMQCDKSYVIVPDIVRSLPMWDHNCGMFEVYPDGNHLMGFHTDSSIDLDPNIPLNQGSVILTTPFVNEHYTNTIIETSRVTRSSYTTRDERVFAYVDMNGTVRLDDGRAISIARGNERRELKSLYKDENNKRERIDYPDYLKPLTLNQGDMMPPVL